MSDHRNAKWTTCDFKDLPEWLLKDSNGYLHKGHRPATASVHFCLRSMFKVHTETGKIFPRDVSAYV